MHGDMVVHTGYPVVLVVMIMVAGEIQTDGSMLVLLRIKNISCFMCNKENKEG